MSVRNLWEVYEEEFDLIELCVERVPLVEEFRAGCNVCRILQQQKKILSGGEFNNRTVQHMATDFLSCEECERETEIIIFI